MTENPFKVLLHTLSDLEYTDVTIGFLKQAAAIINEPSQVVQTYGEMFQVLEFLANAGVVELKLYPDENLYKIRKIT